MSEQVAAAEAPPAAPTPADAIENAEQTETMTVNAKVAEEAATTPVDEHITNDEQAATARKRRMSSPRVSKQSNEAEGDDTESEPEKQPKKRAKTSKGAKRGLKTPGRRKKAAAYPEENAADEQRGVEKKVAALSDDVKGRFGQIVWAKMAGYPFWPCIITDPRLLPKKLQETAMKNLETKYLVFFYVSNNYASISFKMIEPWDDTKNKYREGYPEKDSKAPKRRVSLMMAIEVADKETTLPIEERADGLLRPIERIAAVQSADNVPTTVKRKPGRPPKVKTAPKATKTPEKRQIKEEVADGNDGKELTPATTQEEEEEVVPPLSKEEIKAKVASRKTPKKKGADDVANVVGASAKKTSKATAKHGKLNGSDIDSKRKKEIELVVPHKTVKSADIREMTEEAAKKKLNGPKSKTKKDKGDYKVGDLALFASKMARLYAKESSRNNDELVGMMQELFKETLMYRSDVERSGLAAIIAQLRKKSSNPTVGRTASALRKHMMNILNNDTEITHLGKKSHQDAATSGTKKRKAENGSAVKEELPKVSSPKSSDAKESAAAKDKSITPHVSALPAMKAEDSQQDAGVKTKEENKYVEEAAKAADALVKAEEPAERVLTATEERSASIVKTEKVEKDAVKDTEDLLEGPEHMDKNRTVFVNMLSRILEQDGSQRADLATEIEAALFERFKESHDDYLTQARIIMFGLKDNVSMRKRLFSGALHCLEFAYADDAFFKTTE
ncbi:PWWP domain-containing protein [Phytophthora infestans]|uniref:PWWP domain-containing protein n=1 Tax=Phytophthora infestans TaxID=4787 RepID=A0A833TCT6_PHYIN|nr:PWWP domain-containing protein [Phytophthora infestans]KAF4149253.1 PWWP domain-containing protein [Phytophthora infestans]